ncbi:MAG: PDDEXK nuclease domain-containing protein [Opitutaceae bacterium]|nr:PDDEXK nuclease domain-containing protein [Opitutaceae bacterium]
MKPSADDSVLLAAPDYRRFIADLKIRVAAAQLSAARSVNRDLILLYWDIGRGIQEKQHAHGWGDSVVEMVAADLRRAFPESKSFSADNVWRMRQFYLAYSASEFLGQPVPEIASSGLAAGQLAILGQAVPEMRPGKPQAAPSSLGQLLILLAAVPWGQNLLILKKLTDPAARLFYLRATARFGWSRNVLLNQIKAGAYERAVTEKKTHNFPLALPEHLAEQADEMLKSTYNLEFLGLRRAVRERELEDRLISRLQSFLLELGYGFCFVGRQYRVALGAKEYFIDLLFYHRFLKALVAFDLKVGPFEPEFAGKMDFYLNVLNDRERGPGDQPSIGIILCAEKDDVEVEYALRAKANPIGVAAYTLQSKLPGELKGKLPTAKQLAGIVRAELEEGK